MTTMYQKMTVYAVLAIAIGYLLTSTVPAFITPPEERMLALSEEGIVLATPSTEAGDEGKEAQPSDGGQFWGEMYQYSFLAIDVAIAIGVYMLARRRFG